MLFGCALESQEELTIRSKEQNIWNGYDDADTPWDNHTVRLTRADGRNCSGVLVTPSLVLTASHCIHGEGTTTACSADSDCASDELCASTGFCTSDLINDWQGTIDIGTGASGFSSDNMINYVARDQDGTLYQRSPPMRRSMSPRCLTQDRSLERTSRSIKRQRSIIVASPASDRSCL